MVDWLDYFDDWVGFGMEVGGLGGGGDDWGGFLCGVVWGYCWLELLFELGVLFL